jgi:urease accessory protein
MVCERILGNVADLPVTSGVQELDSIELQWFECPKRAMRKRSRRGRDIAILQPPGQVLRHGDILSNKQDVQISVEVLSSEVLVAGPMTAHELASLAFELGNLHVPVEISDDEIRAAPDGPIMEVIERLQVRSEIRVCRFQPRFVAPGVTLSSSPLQIIRTPGTPTTKVDTPPASRQR